MARVIIDDKDTPLRISLRHTKEGVMVVAVDTYGAEWLVVEFRNNTEGKLVLSRVRGVYSSDIATEGESAEIEVV